MRRFHQFQYKAGAWSRSHKVIARVEATALGTDARFVITNLSGRAKHLYDKVYCQRGCMENLIKDMKALHACRVEDARFQHDQDRLLALAGQSVPPVPAHGRLLAAAHIAPHRARRSVLRGATFETIRAKFVKIAGIRIEELKTRIRLSFPTSCPNADMLATICNRITVRSP